MDFRIARVKSFNLLTLFLVMLLLILIIFTSMIFLSSAIDYLDVSSILAYALLLLLCVPICFITYLSDKQPTTRRIFLALSASYLILSISGITWYLLPQIYTSEFLVPAGKMLMITSYFPIITALFIVYNDQKDNLQFIIKTFVYYTFCAFFLLLALFGISSVLRGNNSFDLFIYSSAILLDVIIISLSILLILLNMATQMRYLFFIIFGDHAFSFIGDTLNLFQYLKIFESGLDPDIFYSVELIFLSIALIIYALSNIKFTTVEEVNKKLKDTSMIVDDLISHSPDAMCMCDVSGEIIKANEEYHRMFPAGQPNNNIFTLPVDKEILESFQKVRTGETVHVACINLNYGQDADRFVSIKIYPTITSDNKLSSYVFMAEDITIRKKAEDTLKMAYDELENRVRERTVELSNLNRALQKEIAEHKQDEEKIKSQLKEKDVLLKEIHHRVKNNMQIITSMLGLQSAHVHEPKFNEILKDSQNRIKSMALIHEKLYQTDNLAEINFSEYINTLIGSINQSYSYKLDKIQIRTEVEDLSFNIDTAIPLGLIINELVTNCFKHAFPNEMTGTICLKIRSENNGMHTLIIKDDGIGLPDGFDIDNTNSLGLQLVSILTDQLDGSLSISRESGTGFTILFK